MTIEYITIGLLVAINLTSFAVMLVDKRRSINGNNTERIPEGILFFLAAVFGSAGIYAAMFILRHKTQKWYFIIGIPLLIMQNLATVYLLRNILLVN